ncbi:unnamed protein product [Arctogadus glacialis]
MKQRQLFEDARKKPRDAGLRIHLSRSAPCYPGHRHIDIHYPGGGQEICRQHAGQAGVTKNSFLLRFERIGFPLYTMDHWQLYLPLPPSLPGPAPCCRHREQSTLPGECQQDSWVTVLTYNVMEIKEVSAKTHQVIRPGRAAERSSIDHQPEACIRLNNEIAYRWEKRTMPMMDMFNQYNPFSGAD